MEWVSRSIRWVVSWFSAFGFFAFASAPGGLGAVVIALLRLPRPPRSPLRPSAPAPSPRTRPAHQRVRAKIRFVRQCCAPCRSPIMHARSRRFSRQNGSIIMCAPIAKMRRRICAGCGPSEEGARTACAPSRTGSTTSRLPSTEAPSTSYIGVSTVAADTSSAAATAAAPRRPPAGHPESREPRSSPSTSHYASVALPQVAPRALIAFRRRHRHLPHHRMDRTARSPDLASRLRRARMHMLSP